MKVVFNKKELVDALAKFDDNDQVVVEVHDDVFTEDLYAFYIDPIHMGLDEKGEDRGHEIRICPIQHEDLDNYLKK